MYYIIFWALKQQKIKNEFMDLIHLECKIYQKYPKQCLPILIIIHQLHQGLRI